MSRQFSQQFEDDALAYVHDRSDLSINACARNLGINANVLLFRAKMYISNTG